ncbi:hypothetical protein D3C87_358720 [compost metagenome]
MGLLAPLYSGHQLLPELRARPPRRLALAQALRLWPQPEHLPLLGAALWRQVVPAWRAASQALRLQRRLLPLGLLRQ